MLTRTLRCEALTSIKLKSHARGELIHPYIAINLLTRLLFRGQIMKQVSRFYRLVSGFVTCTSCALLLIFTTTADAADDPQVVASLIEKLGLRDGTTAARERKGWHMPRKIVVLGSANALTNAVGNAKLVMVNTPAEAAKAAIDADVVVGLTSEGGICEREIIDNAKQLRWILSMSAGVERCVAIQSVKDRDILITNLRGVASAAIAEHAIALTMALTRNLNEFVTHQNAGRWSRTETAGMQVLTGKTMLVVGLGGIGTEVASRGHALGMKVVATRNSGREGPSYISYVGLADEMLKLAKDADVIVNAAPLTAATTGIFDKKFFATLKPTTYFINVARGGSVVTDDLVAALNERRIAGAGLDVVDPEPLPANHPLWKAPNLILTPHISSATDLPGQERWIVARENLRRYMAGEKMLSVVDLNQGY
jgi:phosphoglycerate dehydrogenase-like enzyme